MLLTVAGRLQARRPYEHVKHDCLGAAGRAHRFINIAGLFTQIPCPVTAVPVLNQILFAPNWCSHRYAPLPAIKVKAAKKSLTEALEFLAKGV